MTTDEARALFDSITCAGIDNPDSAAGRLRAGVLAALAERDLFAKQISLFNDDYEALAAQSRAFLSQRDNALEALDHLGVETKPAR